MSGSQHPWPRVVEPSRVVTPQSMQRALPIPTPNIIKDATLDPQPPKQNNSYESGSKHPEKA